ncbi:dihydroorotate dehydrogenase [Acidobacteriota bacterium]
MSTSVDLSVVIAGVTWKNPVSTASGTFGYGLEFEPFVDLSRLGSITVKGLSREPVQGNPPPRIAETPAGMLNAIGLQNIGVEVFVKEKLPKLLELETPIYANIFGYTVEEYEAAAAYLDGVDGIAGLEVNISCPNIKCGGMAFGVTPEATKEVVGVVRKASKLPMLVKLSPNVTDVCAIARAAVEAGADGLTLINTLRGMAIDIKQRKPVLAMKTGGLSGPAIRPVALRIVYEVASAVSVPIIGVGGISTASDVLEFLMAGATGVQIGTANFRDPQATIKAIEKLEQWLDREGVKSIKEIIGAAQE